MVGRQHRARLAEALRTIFAVTEASHARAVARGCAERWRRSHPAVAAKREEELDACLACYEVPAAHRGRVRTTNGLARVNPALKRRTRVVRIFPNRASLLRLVTALALAQSEAWVSGRRYLAMELLWAQQPRPAPVAPVTTAA